MSEKELSELNAWIAEHVMGFEKEPHPDETGWRASRYKYLACFNPTTDPAAAMQVLEKCSDRCSSLDPMIGMVIWKDGGMFGVDSQGWESDDQIPETIPAETLPLAIALFAKQLFSKE